MTNRVLSAISLCKKAGKIVSGEFSVLEAVKKKKAKLVIVSEDASENTKKLFSDKSGYRAIPVLLYGTKESLGRAIGAKNRAVVAVTDDSFKNMIIKQINGEEFNDENEIT